MADKSVRSLVPVALIAALLVVGLNTWFAVASIRSLLQSEQWLAHTWQVLGQNERLLVAVATAESSARGFLITGNEGLLSTFEGVQQSMPRELRHFQELTADNPIEQGHIAKSREIIMRRMNLLEEIIQVRRQQGFEAGQAIARCGTGHQRDG